MDELWQRYRAFWMPVLIGLGVFLVGLIVVHVVTDDPDQWERTVQREAQQVRGRVEPSKDKIRAMRENRDLLEKNVEDWAKRLDQAHLEDPVDSVVTEALQASLLRGLTPETLRAALGAPESEVGRDALARFDGDTVAAGKALAKYQDVRQQRLNVLRTGDLNVGFTALLQDVWSELRVRANRADVELKTDVLGFGGVTSVSRAVLAQRALNLALVSQIVDLAIRSGVLAVQDVRLRERANPLGDEEFLREWPFDISLRGDMASLRPVLEFLTDPKHPVALTSLVLSQPSRGSPLEGQVQLQATAASVLVRPQASLDLETEERR